MMSTADETDKPRVKIHLKGTALDIYGTIIDTLTDPGVQLE
jgi:hypothetical protein